jgi:hypothetical protein
VPRDPGLVTASLACETQTGAWKAIGIVQVFEVEHVEVVSPPPNFAVGFGGRESVDYAPLIFTVHIPRLGQSSQLPAPCAVGGFGLWGKL